MTNATEQKLFTIDNRKALGAEKVPFMQKRQWNN